MDDPLKETNELNCNQVTISLHSEKLMSPQAPFSLSPLLRFKELDDWRRLLRFMPRPFLVKTIFFCPRQNLFHGKKFIFAW